MADFVQSSYFNSPELGYEGQIVQLFADQPAIFSHWAEGDVYPGRAVIKGTDTVQTANQWFTQHIPYGVLHPSADTDVLVGIPILEYSLPNDSSGNVYYPTGKRVVSVLKRGSVIGKPYEAVVPHDPVYVVWDATNVTGVPVGGLVASADIGGAEVGAVAIQLPNSYFYSAAAAEGKSIVVIASDPAI